jgi:hypothetical protein
MPLMLPLQPEAPAEKLPLHILRCVLCDTRLTWSSLNEEPLGQIPVAPPKKIKRFRLAHFRGGQLELPMLSGQPVAPLALLGGCHDQGCHIAAMALLMPKFRLQN